MLNDFSSRSFFDCRESFSFQSHVGLGHGPRLISLTKLRLLERS